MSARVWVTRSFVGFHHWPDAPDGRNYLGKRHRHLFGVRVEVPVRHDDRDVEFHDLSRLVEDTCERMGDGGAQGGRELGAMSCEAIARLIAQEVVLAFHCGEATVHVDEDGECGATVDYTSG